MFNARSLACGAALVGSLTLFNCEKTSTAETVAPTTDPADEAARKPAGGGEKVATIPQKATTPKPPKAKIHVQLALEGVADVMEAVKQITANATPDTPSDPMAQLQAMLLTTGFGPGFLGNIDVDALHALALAIPPDGGSGPKDLELSAAIGVIDARRVLDGMPSSLRPQPLGAGMWELPIEDVRLLLEEGGNELRLGMTADELKQSAGLRAKVGSGRRIRARADGLKALDLDPAAMLPLGDLPFGPQLAQVLEEVETVEVEAEVGTKRDLTLLTRAHAPFRKLGVEPLGGPRTGATELESRLPAGSVFATTLSFGDPKLIHESLDRYVPLDLIPEPFTAIAKGALGGVHALLDQFAGDLAVALYAQPDGQASVLFAANVEDEALANGGIRKIHEAVVATLQEFAAIQGDNEGSKFIIAHQPDSLTLAGVKADRLSIGIPKDFRTDLEHAEIFIKKDAIEGVSFASGKTLVVVFGSGAQTLATDIAKGLGKPRSTSLAGDQGLARVRGAMEGCQVCSSIDLEGYLRFRLLLLKAIADRQKDKAAQKEIKGQITALAKASDVGQPSIGFTIGQDDAEAAVIVPESLAFASKETLAAYKAVSDFLGRASGSTPPEVVACAPGSKACGK